MGVGLSMTWGRRDAGDQKFLDIVLFESLFWKIMEAKSKTMG